MIDWRYIVSMVSLCLGGCALFDRPIGENQHFAVVPKERLLRLYNLSEISEATAECFRPAAAQEIVADFCTSFAASKPGASEQKACIKRNLELEGGGAKFQGEIVKKGWNVARWKDLAVDKCKFRSDDMDHDLGHVYYSSLPNVATDGYDTRVSRFREIAVGDPVSILVNRVWIKTVHGNFWRGRTAKVAVVLSVDDGSDDGGKDYLVAYQEGISDRTTLPIADLLAYSSDSYRGQPIRIALTVFEFRSIDEQFKGLLTSALGAIPASAVGTISLSPLTQGLGKYLLERNSQEIVLRFVFQLYPWGTGAVAVTENSGVPRIAKGNYLLINAQTEEEKKALEQRKLIHLDWDLRPYLVERRDDVCAPGDSPVWKASCAPKKQSNRKQEGAEYAGDGARSKGQATPAAEQTKKDAETNEKQASTHANIMETELGLSHMVLTVDSTPMFGASTIIKRADQTFRQAAKLGGISEISQEELGDVQQSAKKLSASIKTIEALREFQTAKGHLGVALETLMQTAADLRKEFGDASEETRQLERQVQTILPEESDSVDDCAEPLSDACRKWWKANKSKYVFARDSGRFVQQK